MSRTELLATDLYQMRWILDPSLSPDGQRVAYVLKQAHPEDVEERYRHELILLETLAMPPDGVGRRLLPDFDASIRNLAWSPSGEILAFVSNRSGKNQIWLLTVASGTLRQLTDAPKGVSGFDWSPDGRQLAYVGDVADDSGEFGEHRPERFRVIRRLGYKTDGSGYWNASWPQLFVVDVAIGDHPVVGSQLTTARYGVISARWAPSGDSIAYIAPGETDPDRSAIRSIFVAELTDLGTVVSDTRQLTENLAIQSLTWSPSGNEIAFIGDDLSDDRATNAGLWVVRVRDKQLVNLSADIDRPAGDYVTDDMNVEAGAAAPSWTNDGRTIMVIMSDRGRSIVASFGYPGDKAYTTGVAQSYASEMRDDPWHGSTFGARPVQNDEQRVFAIDYDGADTLVVARSSPSCPGDIYLLPTGASTQAEHRLTDVNRDLLAERIIVEPEPISFAGSESRRIEGWLLTPGGTTDSHYPLILHIHGGPHSAYSSAFNFELQHLAAQGYAVLFVNPHGSHTYGRAINTGTRHDWGGKDYNDLMLAVDHVLDRPNIDESRLGVAGGSYGGWMTNYIVTRTNRFKAAVAQRSSSNRISTMLSSTVGYKHQRWEAPGYPWEDLDYFVRISPALHAAKVETPLLLEHSEEDHLCPLMQPEEMFTALKALGKPVELLYFLGESHHMLRNGKPGNRVERLERVAAWFDRYV